MEAIRDTKTCFDGFLSQDDRERRLLLDAGFCRVETEICDVGPAADPAGGWLVPEFFANSRKSVGARGRGAHRRERSPKALNTDATAEGNREPTHT